VSSSRAYSPSALLDRPELTDWIPTNSIPTGRDRTTSTSPRSTRTTRTSHTPRVHTGTPTRSITLHRPTGQSWRENTSSTLARERSSPISGTARETIATVQRTHTSSLPMVSRSTSESNSSPTPPTSTTTRPTRTIGTTSSTDSLPPRTSVVTPISWSFTGGRRPTRRHTTVFPLSPTG